MSLQVYKYRLPFKQPLQTSKRTFDHREGIILEYSTSGSTFFGEAAPLPGYSTESFEEVEGTIVNLMDTTESLLNGGHPCKALQNLYEDKDLPASLQFGLDALAYQIEADRAGQTLQEFLFQDFKQELPVNALGSLQSDNYLENTRTLIEAGFQTIKYKIGMDFDSEFDLLKHIRSEFPDLTIRLDANQAFSIEEALQYSEKLVRLRIEYCEEPLKEPTPENYELLNQQTNLPLALDESLYRVSYWPNLLPFTSYLILKPMLLGSFTKLFETKRFASTHGNKAVFTSSLESGIGRMMTAILASDKESSETAHGLSTGDLLAKDVYSDKTYISDGQYHIKKLEQVDIDFQRLSDVSSSLFPNGE